MPFIDDIIKMLLFYGNIDVNINTSQHSGMDSFKLITLCVILNGLPNIYIYIYIYYNYSVIAPPTNVKQPKQHQT